MFPEKSNLISLLVTSLVLGVLLLVNLDRATHAELPFAGSEHGWPLVFLVRTPSEMNFAGADPPPFPWPPVESEHRVFSWMNLTTDLIVGISIVVITYVMLRTVLQGIFGRSE